MKPVVEIDYLSIDPAMRTWMNAGRSYVPPVEIGEVMRALAVGHVVESRRRENTGKLILALDAG